MACTGTTFRVASVLFHLLRSRGGDPTKQDFYCKMWKIVYFHIYVYSGHMAPVRPGRTTTPSIRFHAVLSITGRSPLSSRGRRPLVPEDSKNDDSMVTSWMTPRRTVAVPRMTCLPATAVELAPTAISAPGEGRLGGPDGKVDATSSPGASNTTNNFFRSKPPSSNWRSITTFPRVCGPETGSPSTGAGHACPYCQLHGGLPTSQSGQKFFIHEDKGSDSGSRTNVIGVRRPEGAHDHQP